MAAAVFVRVRRFADICWWAWCAWAAAAAARSGEVVGGKVTPAEELEDDASVSLLEDLPCLQVRLPSDLSAISSSCLGLMSVCVSKWVLRFDLWLKHR